MHPLQAVPFRFTHALWLLMAKQEANSSSLLTGWAVHGAFAQVALTLEIAAVFGLYVWTQRRILGTVTKTAARMTVACWVLLAVHSMIPFLVVASAKPTARESREGKTAFTAGLREIASAACLYHTEYGKWPSDTEQLLARHNMRGIAFFGLAQTQRRRRGADAQSPI